ncbi:hypothetical protein BGY98DRAFT_951242 [Russula aff. rugulosa BPL654]|nr:hypothetical protein BGY98DRAFT_951242 [Russula aff. rugulosa BPL654]
MSLTRAALFVSRPQGAYISRIQCRSASSQSHGHDEHHGTENESYPKEGFTSSGWTYTLIAALGIVGFYKFAPSPGEENYVTRYISHYFTPSSSWAAANDRHLELTANLQDAIQISQTGQRPHIHRYRYPHSLEVASSFSVPVGGDPDVSGVRVKGRNEFNV